MKSVNLKFGLEKSTSTTPDPLGIVYFLPSAICIAVETALSLVNGKSKEHTFTNYSKIAEYSFKHLSLFTELITLLIHIGAVSRKSSWNEFHLSKILASYYRLDNNLGLTLNPYNLSDRVDIRPEVLVDVLSDQVLANNELITVFGNGRWAAYKTAEILYKSHGFNLQVPDMGNANSSGPRKGLGLFFPGLPQGNSPSDVAQLDELSAKVVDYLQGKVSQVSMETAETSLCDFYAMSKGRYYVGIDIDEMQEQLLRVPSDLTAMGFKARSETLPHRYLGELNGWEGIDKNRKTIYRTTRQIALR